MELFEVRQMALELLGLHGLKGWRVQFDHARTRPSQCRPQRHTLSLSAPLMRLAAPAEVREAILHEIAHALVGADHGHDAQWRLTAQRLGASGVTTMGPRAMPRHEWVGTCPAGHRVERYRRPQRPLSCGECEPGEFSLPVLLRWTFRGRPVPMTPAYRAAETALRADATQRAG